MDIFEYAIQMEKDGEAYYREAAEKAGDAGLKKIFTMMADDEKKHVAIFQAMANSEQAGYTDSSVLSDSKNIFAELKESGSKVSPDTSQKEVYQTALDNEKKSEKYYLEKAEEVQDAGQKDILQKLADEEKRHAWLLQNIIDFISRPDEWVENAEFTHLEEY